MKANKIRKDEKVYKKESPKVTKVSINISPLILNSNYNSVGKADNEEEKKKKGDFNSKKDNNLTRNEIILVKKGAKEEEKKLTTSFSPNNFPAQNKLKFNPKPNIEYLEYLNNELIKVEKNTSKIILQDKKADFQIDLTNPSLIKTPKTASKKQKSIKINNLQNKEEDHQTISNQLSNLNQIILSNQNAEKVLLNLYNDHSKINKKKYIKKKAQELFYDENANSLKSTKNALYLKHKKIIGDINYILQYYCHNYGGIYNKFLLSNFLYDIGFITKENIYEFPKNDAFQEEKELTEMILEIIKLPEEELNYNLLVTIISAFFKQNITNDKLVDKIRKIISEDQVDPEGINVISQKLVKLVAKLTENRRLTDQLFETKKKYATNSKILNQNINMPQTNKNSSELSKKNTKKIVEKYLSNINRKNSDTIFHSFKNSETNSELFDLRFSKKIINLNDRNGMKKQLSGSKLSIYDIFEIKEQLKLDKINENRRNLENEAKKCLVFSQTIN